LVNDAPAVKPKRDTADGGGRKSFPRNRAGAGRKRTSESASDGKRNLFLFRLGQKAEKRGAKREGEGFRQRERTVTEREVGLEERKGGIRR